MDGLTDLHVNGFMVGVGVGVEEVVGVGVAVCLVGVLDGVGVDVGFTRYILQRIIGSCVMVRVGVGVCVVVGV